MKELRVVLIEDEATTARNLAYLLQNIDAGIHIVTTLESVQESVAWLNDNFSAYDLIFSDIRLTDGLSFEIFKKVDLNAPVIFVTAYDHYAIEAFKNNGIDYILKPFDGQEIQAALTKFHKLTALGKTESETTKISMLLKLMSQTAKTYKKSFLIPYRNKLIPVESNQIAWFYTINDIVYAQTFDAQQYIIEETLEELEKQLDPDLFFRANRQYIVNRKAILEVEFYFNGRLLIQLTPNPTDQVLVSKARSSNFKSWMSQ